MRIGKSARSVVQSGGFGGGGGVVEEDAEGLGPAAVAVIVGDEGEAAGGAVDEAAGAVLGFVDFCGRRSERGA